MLYEERIARLNQFVAEGRVIREKWTGTDAAGRETACLLAALSPEAGRNGEASECPADVMPAWMAHLTPWIDDSVSAEIWPEVVGRYANIASRWHVLSSEDWRRLDFAVRGICVREAMQHTDNMNAQKACLTVILLCDRAFSGEVVPSEEWAAARAAAAAAAAAEAAASDRIVDQILTAFEQAIKEKSR